MLSLVAVDILVLSTVDETIGIRSSSSDAFISYFACGSTEKFPPAIDSPPWIHYPIQLIHITVTLRFTIYAVQVPDPHQLVKCQHLLLIYC